MRSLGTASGPGGALVEVVQVQPAAQRAVGAQEAARGRRRGSPEAVGRGRRAGEVGVEAFDGQRVPGFPGVGRLPQQRKLAPVLDRRAPEGGVHAIGVGAQQRPLFRRKVGVDPAGQLGKAQAARQAVEPQGAFAKPLAEAPGGRLAPQRHQPGPLGAVDVAERRVAIAQRIGADGRHPRVVPGNVDGTRQSLHARFGGRGGAHAVREIPQRPPGDDQYGEHGEEGVERATHGSRWTSGERVRPFGKYTKQGGPLKQGLVCVL
jgi:hypothetical protein